MTGADPLTISRRLMQWLEHGREFFSEREFFRLRALVVEIRRARRDEALQAAAMISEELVTLGEPATPSPSPPEIPADAAVHVRSLTTSTVTLPVVPGPTLSIANAVRGLTRAVVGEHPGLRSARVTSLVQARMPHASDVAVALALSFLSKPGGALRKEGTRGQYTYFPAEPSTHDDRNESVTT